MQFSQHQSWSKGLKHLKTPVQYGSCWGQFRWRWPIFQCWTLAWLKPRSKLQIVSLCNWGSRVISSTSCIPWPGKCKRLGWMSTPLLRFTVLHSQFGESWGKSWAHAAYQHKLRSCLFVQQCVGSSQDPGLSIHNTCRQLDNDRSWIEWAWRSHLFHLGYTCAGISRF